MNRITTRSTSLPRLNMFWEPTTWGGMFGRVWLTGRAPSYSWDRFPSSWHSSWASPWVCLPATMAGWIDELVMRVLDALMAFPTILLYMIIISAIGPSPINVVIAIAIGGAPGHCPPGARIDHGHPHARVCLSRQAARRLGHADHAARNPAQLPWSVDRGFPDAHRLRGLLHRHVGLSGIGIAAADARLGRHGAGRSQPHDDQYLAGAGLQRWRSSPW